jgi:hypothetical protein
VGRALAHLGGGDLVGYRASCAALVKRFGRTENPEDFRRVATTCLLAPEAVTDFTDLELALKRRVAENPKVCTYHHLLGRMYCRTGRWKEALLHLEAALQTPYHLKNGSDLTDRLFLAMSHHYLGQADEARKWLDKAVQGIDQAAKAQPLSWTRRVELQLLRREAEALRQEPPPAAVGNP